MENATQNPAAEVASASVSKSKKRRQSQKKLPSVQGGKPKAESSKQATEAAEKPFRFMDLPYDIRIIIYRICFARPICIVPAVNFYKRRPNRRRDGYTGGWVKYSAYKYQWAGAQQILEYGDYNLPSRDGSWLLHDVSWVSEATQEQRNLIELGLELPSTGQEIAMSSKVTHGIFNLENLQIRNSQSHFIRGIFGIKLLRTCKQLRREGTEILYGCNTFDFSALYLQPYSFLTDQPHTIPGLSSAEGATPSDLERSECIENLFDRRRRHSKFLWGDPFTKFMIKIGQYNAGLIKAIRLNGTFKTEYYNHGDHYKISIAQCLTIYVLILKSACQNLRRVTLQANKGEGFWPQSCNEDSHMPKESDEATIDGIVESFVKGLPQLRQLCLGKRGELHGSETNPTDSQKIDDEKVFGKALRWVEIVRERPESTNIGPNDA